MPKLKKRDECTERAVRLHDFNLVVDAHFDLLMDVLDKREKGRRRVIEEDHLPSMKKAGLDLVVSSLFVSDSFVPDMALRRALDQIGALHREIDESGDKLALCRTWSDVELAKEQGKLAVILSFEGVEPISNDIGLLRIFYELGVRGVGLVWSRRNYAGDGCFFSERREGRKGGLTDFGVKVLDEIASLGMFLDVSHLNDEGFQDVLDFYDGPFIASHSNCRSLMGTMRNLTDDHIMSLAQRGGVMGMNSCSTFVADEAKVGPVTAKHLADHVDHIKKLVGIEHVGFGFDFCDMFRVNSGSSSYDCISGYSHLSDLTAELLMRGYSDDEAAMVMGGNLARFYREALK
ncbi:MAG: membrane dipeptidase [Synergistales bacterium]|nr:membrane dipeptidase [Dethiosulfovibrio sp.]NCC95950.1 membrane dipeptidase [Synergistales bacterium]